MALVSLSLCWAFRVLPRVKVHCGRKCSSGFTRCADVSRKRSVPIHFFFTQPHTAVGAGGGSCTGAGVGGLFSVTTYRADLAAFPFVPFFGSFSILLRNAFVFAVAASCPPFSCLQAHRGELSLPGSRRPSPSGTSLPHPPLLSSLWFPSLSYFLSVFACPPLPPHLRACDGMYVITCPQLPLFPRSLLAVAEPTPPVSVDGREQFAKGTGGGDK